MTNKGGMFFAAKGGFNNESHFSRIFRKHYGVSPKEARNSRKTVLNESLDPKLSLHGLYEAVSTINFWQSSPCMSVTTGIENQITSEIDWSEPSVTSKIHVTSPANSFNLVPTPARSGSRGK